MRHGAGGVIMVNKMLPFIRMTILLTMVCPMLLFAQSDIPVGTWRTHFSYNKVLQMVAATDQQRIYAATENALFYLDQSDNSVNKISKLDGLSDAGISCLQYKDGLLAIGYQSGFVDFIEKNTIRSFKALAEAPQLDNKSISSVYVRQNRAYIATVEGLVVVNLATFTIVESYTQIGPGASRVQVRDVVVSGDSIFLATDIGLMSALLSPQRNLQDFNNWRVSFPQVNSRSFSQLTSLSDGLALISGSNIWTYRSGTWSNITPAGVISTKLYNRGGALFFIGNAADGQYRVYDGAMNIVYATSDQIHGLLYYDNKLYLATERHGIRTVQGQAVTNVVLNGPHADQAARLTTIDGHTYQLSPVLTNNRRSQGLPAVYSVFNKGSWSVSTIPSFSDITQVLGKQPIFSSYGKGIFKSADGAIINDKTSGSPLLPGRIPPEGPLITDIQADANGGIWVANYDANPSLHYLKNAGGWASVALGNSLSARYPLALAVSKRSGIVWIQIDPIFGGGLYAHSPSSNTTRFLTRAANNLPSNVVNSVAIDLNDEVWVGTDNGVAYFPSSTTPFSNSFDRAIVPIFDGDELLRGQHISCIGIDPGNRKWLGTRNGLWVFSENADNLIHRFTARNSPLPSDTIVAISFDETNGEVFVATTKGTASYRSDATKADDTFSAVKVFPNPILPDYTGMIGIEGLGYNLSVKITDLSGRLVRELQSNGGSASWDGLDINGQRVSTGTYLLFAGNADGTASFVGKFAVIR